jgi:hypothetical protein
VCFSQCVYMCVCVCVCVEREIEREIACARELECERNIECVLLCVCVYLGVKKDRWGLDESEGSGGGRDIPLWVSEFGKDADSPSAYWKHLMRFFAQNPKVTAQIRASSKKKNLLLADG